MPRVALEFDPRLDVDPDEFVRAWNGASDAQAAGVATPISEDEPVVFGDPNVVSVFVDLVVGVSGAALYDLLGNVVRRMRPGQRAPKVTEQDSAGGEGPPVVRISPPE